MRDRMYDESTGDTGSALAHWMRLGVKWGGAALSLTLVLSLLVWGYRLSTRDMREVPVIKAMSEPARIAPVSPGGQEAAHQGLEVNEILAGDPAGTPGQTELAPAPVMLSEEPAPTPVRVDPVTPVQVDEPDTASAALSTPESEAQTIADLVEEVVNEAGGLRPRLRPTNLIAAGLAPAPEPTPVPAQRPASATEPAAAAQPAVLDIRPATITAPSSEPSVASVPAGTRTVQLGAFGSDRDARSAWSRLTVEHGDLLSQRETYIQEALSNDRTFFRLRVLGFQTSDEQNGLCDALRARDVACIPVTVR